MAEDTKDPTNADILTALRGMWRPRGDLVKGVETRLQAKMDTVGERLDKRLDAAEERLAARLAKEIQNRPVVVHIDMSRVSELEKQMAELAKRVAELEARTATH